jgi:peptidyl-dipeptidase Dcp
MRAMKSLTIILILGAVMLTSCEEKTGNPFFTEYDTPLGTPPFERIQIEHYRPAFFKGIEEHNVEVQNIIAHKETTFQNTIVELEKSGALLDKVSSVFYNLTSAHTNDSLQAISKEMAPVLTKHRDAIRLNADLFKKIKKLYDEKERLNLDAEQLSTLELYYKRFVRGGANLKGADKEAFKKINEELSLLTIEFGENVLNEVNRFEMTIDKKADLAGLPQGAIDAAAELASEKQAELDKKGDQSKNYTGKWVFSISKPSLIPFLQYAENRKLREKMYKAYIMQGDNNDENDNKKILEKIVSLRLKRANLLGFETHAAYVLDDNMAKNSANVYALLNKIWPASLAKAKEERTQLQKMIEKEGKKFKLQAWDWWYYAEKWKKEKYDLDEEALRPYFELDNVRKGAFILATKLFGITFHERTDISKYHPDVEVFEVKEADGSHIGILYTDYFPRASKRGGAWMNEYRPYSNMNGKEITPIICNVGNFSKPTADTPALLSFDEVLTLFHEFGHALHGLLAASKYPSISGTNVARDFVEMPSQVLENWAYEPELLKLYAKHYKTGEIIPQELVDKVQESAQFNQGFATTEYLAASFLDLDWHNIKEYKNNKANEFEKAALDKIGLINEIASRYRSAYFRHIFSGGYSAGYYSYVWAEVYDADAYEAFREKGIFDKETAQAFRKYILAAGASENAMVLYKKFRGSEPQIEPLLKRKGLN